MSDEINTAICHSEKVLNKPSNSWFVIDSIEVPSISVLADGGTMDKIDSESTFEALRQSEYQFINRVNQIIESNQSELV